MTDETKPPRIRGQKERAVAYQAGFMAGLTHALAEIQKQREMEQERETAMREGLAKLGAAPVVRRTRRKKGDVGGPASSAVNPQ